MLSFCAYNVFTMQCENMAAVLHMFLSSFILVSTVSAQVFQILSMVLVNSSVVFDILIALANSTRFNLFSGDINFIWSPMHFEKHLSSNEPFSKSVKTFEISDTSLMTGKLNLVEFVQLAKAEVICGKANGMHFGETFPNCC